MKRNPTVIRRETGDRSCLFGPVPSRRLGRSLGIDVIPPKTCTLDCLYCESGSTTCLTVRRRAFVSPQRVLRELEDFLETHPGGVDALTFSAAGEPTLYEPLGDLVEAVKSRFPDHPLVMLTNGTLLWDPAVRRALLQVDRVIPSLDAADERTFQALNRPHPKLNLDRLIEGLTAFRREYKGQYHLEIVLVRGFNDSEAHLQALSRWVDKIRPDRVELNTVVRPPARSGITGLSPQEMMRAASFFPKDRTDVIGTFTKKAPLEASADLEQRIARLVRRRPCPISEMAEALGATMEQVRRSVSRLEARGQVFVRSFDGRDFVCAREEGSDEKGSGDAETIRSC